MHASGKAQGPGGWEDAERAGALAARIPAETGLSAEDARALFDLCAASADPDGALAGATRALAAHYERFGGPGARESLPALVLVCAASKFLAATLAARPRLIDLLASRRFAQRPMPLHAHGRTDAVSLARRLRRHKQAEVLRIALLDLSGGSVSDVTRALSKLAADAFDAAVQFHYRRLCAQHGPPHGRRANGPSGFCVLGMGKLGGEELNFSSDADVFYVYDKDGKTANGLDHFAFYARLAEAVTASVGSPQAAPDGGFVFRVDLDLRPEGRSGPIVNAIRGLELYYEAQGAAWERFALLKARPIAGDLETGDEALRRLLPFVFRKYFDLKAIDEMRRLKARAEKEAARASGIDLKLGKGGIREIEFFVQALQLLHGGRDPNLRVRGTLKALQRLLYAGIISSRDRDELSEAYIVLRRLEHRVQMVAERQTHSIPDDPAERERLARRAGYPNAEEMLADLAVHGAHVEARFRDLLHVAGGGPSGENPFAAAAADPLAGDDERAAALAELGFDQPDASAEELSRLARKRGTPFAPDSAHAALGAVLVQELAVAPDPDQALRHLTDLFGQMRNPAAAADMLAASPRTARLLVSLFGSSDFLGRSLLRHPELIDQLVHRGSAPLVRERDDLRNDLGNRLAALPSDDVEGALTELRRFRNEEVLRIGLHDIAGALSVEQVTRQLSDLADACVERCFAMAVAEIEKRDGTSAATMAVIALGKLGGRELGYHSDLDLLFLYSSSNASAFGSGPSPAEPAPPGETDRHVSNHEHFARIAQRMISHLTLPLREGALYRIDTRLRPSGSAGPLVISFEALQTYHAREARLWERQALLRARPVAGDEALFARAYAQVLDPSIFRSVDRSEAAKEMLAMRERMEREIADESAGRYNSKLGRGGLVDVEFAAQFLQLVHGAENPRVRQASTPLALDALSDAGVLSPQDHAALSKGYRFLRRLESRLRIVRDRAVDRLPESGKELLRLARRMGYSGAKAGEELLAEYQKTSEEVRAAFLRVMT
ncbi:MAG: bifunctional [glutamate--ammonia ligase]-adenylyl-L-tyrosine phosphorylase/[glutamate--ammonia-ligase] adenylyltransferase [Myxococcales bacterium]|nr:bifunctional [glutamate--ammonia ligase]-adenylyl-L-tyrosine phosphorylase/[glutamate--ammonia-ligase] adenylyltransferase [Myxococcales bacterium]